MSGDDKHNDVTAVGAGAPAPAPAGGKKGVLSAKRSKTAQDAPDICVFIGPNIRGRIQYGTVFPSREKALEAMAEEISAFPALTMLLVPGKELPKARAEVNTSGTMLNRVAGNLRAALSKSN